MVRRLLVLILVWGGAAAAQPAAPLSNVAVRLDGEAGGYGDIKSVAITATSPLTGTATCLTGACSFTLGLGTVTVAKGGTGLTAGTDGGILGYTATGTLASSIALTLHALLVGGGAGATPTPLGSLGTSTTVLHGAAAGDPTWGAVALGTDVSGQLPIANGGTASATAGAALTALGAQSAATANAILAAQYFGDGSDGALSINSGTTTLTRDMYYSNVTISGTASLVTAGYRVMVSGTLDLTNAPVAAITVATGTAGNSTANTAAPTTQANTGCTSFGWISSSTALASSINGAAGATTTGTTIARASTVFSYLYRGAVGGSGGTGGSGSGGASTDAAVGHLGFLVPPFYQNYAPSVPAPMLCAQNGVGGGSGGGDGTAGGGSGNGGGGPGIISIWAATISRGGSTTAGAITGTGGAGGNAGVPAAGNRGGGGGGGGGAGAMVYIVYGTLSGSQKAGAITSVGGAGGNGGNGTGTGTGGDGGTGGPGGEVFLWNLSTGTLTLTGPTAGTTGGSHTGTTGGTGSAAGTTTASL